MIVTEKRENDCPERIPSPKPPRSKPAKISPITGGCFNRSKRNPKRRAKIRAIATDRIISKI